MASIKVSFDHSLAKKMADWFGIKSKSYWNQLLLCAVIDGNEAITNEAIQHDADINFKSETYLNTPLMLASEIGHDDLISSLISKGAEINYQNIEGSTALMRACANGHSVIVFNLLTAGADLEIKNKKGCTALLLAREWPSVIDAIRAYCEQEQLSKLIDVIADSQPCCYF